MPPGSHKSQGSHFLPVCVLEQKLSLRCCYSEACPSDSHPIFWSCPVSFFLPVSAPKFLEQVPHHLPGFLCGSLFLSPHQAGLAAPGFTSLVHWNQALPKSGGPLSLRSAVALVLEVANQAKASSRHPEGCCSTSRCPKARIRGNEPPQNK